MKYLKLYRPARERGTILICDEDGRACVLNIGGQYAMWGGESDELDPSLVHTAIRHLSTQITDRGVRGRILTTLIEVGSFSVPVPTAMEIERHLVLLSVVTPDTLDRLAALDLTKSDLEDGTSIELLSPGEIRDSFIDSLWGFGETLGARAAYDLFTNINLLDWKT